MSLIQVGFTDNLWYKKTKSKSSAFISAADKHECDYNVLSESIVRHITLYDGLEK